MSVFATSSATPETLLIVLPAPVTFSVPLCGAWMPRPVLSMSRPPPVRFSVWPSLASIVIALFCVGLPLMVVLIVFAALLKVVEPPVLVDSEIPPPASFVSFDRTAEATAPPLRPVISAVWPGPLLKAPGKVTLPLPPSRSKLMPAAPAIVLLASAEKVARAETGEVDAVARAVRRVDVVEAKQPAPRSCAGDVDRRSARGRDVCRAARRDETWCARAAA